MKMFTLCLFVIFLHLRCYTGKRCNVFYWSICPIRLLKLTNFDTNGLQGKGMKQSTLWVMKVEDQLRLVRNRSEIPFGEISQELSDIF